MKERTQVNIRLDRDLLDELDELASADRVDRSEMARRLLETGMTGHRMDRAVREYRKGNVSAWKAAEIAGVSLYEMLDRIHDEGIPYEIDPETFQRIGAPDGKRTAVAEAPAPYRGDTDEVSGVAELREQFRPTHVRMLFVGESSPAAGTHFYRANSNLFRATQEAFALAFGESVPDGPGFLHDFRERGCWLVDLADRPVNRLAGRPRRDVVDAGVERLASLISETKPERIVVVKATIAAAVRQAAGRAAFTGEIVELPFPVRQWRTAYLRQLARALRPDALE